MLKNQDVAGSSKLKSIANKIITGDKRIKIGLKKLLKLLKKIILLFFNFV